MIKKMLFVIFILFVILTFMKISNKTYDINESNKVMKGIYISYIDYSKVLKDKDTNTMDNNIKEMVNNISDFGFNTIILQVRSFGDAIYNSSIFPFSKTISSTGVLNLDVLECFLKYSTINNIKIIAWINPYRISNSKVISFDSSIFNAWKDTTNIEILDSGTFLNPASDDVLNLILDGISELISNYNIDGILYDDYFYPNKTIDLADYAIYKNNNPEVTIEQYRIDNIYRLISKSYERVKSFNKDVLFGIAPSGNISNNLNDEYLDVSSILKGDKILDFVSPQLYYGFDNGAKPFIRTLEQWNGLISNDIKLLPSLALYKAGLSDKYAGEGINEWQNNDDIIKRQILSLMAENSYGGYAIYRYDNVFNTDYQNDNMKMEVNNLKDIIKK